MHSIDAINYVSQEHLHLTVSTTISKLWMQNIKQKQLNNFEELEVAINIQTARSHNQTYAVPSLSKFPFYLNQEAQKER